MSRNRGETDPFTLLDLTAWNPWWQSDNGDQPPDRIPAKMPTRADFPYRLENTLNNDILLIPGPEGTGTDTTLKQLIRALVRGEEYEEATVHRVLSPDYTLSGRDARQICYVPCNDSLARLTESLVDSARQLFHPRAARTGASEFYMFFDGIHRLNDWREQLFEAYTDLQRDFPDEDWTFVATVPATRLADIDTTDFVPSEGTVDFEADLPHHTQKFRNSLLDGEDEAYASIHDTEPPLYIQIRRAITEVSTGSGDIDELEALFGELEDILLTEVGLETIQTKLDRYLVGGGFDPALDAETDTSDPDSATDYAETMQNHIQRSLDATIYRELPHIAEVMDDIKRIEEPRDLHAVCTYLARQPLRESSYKELASLLDRDSRTIKQKYIAMLEDFHVIGRQYRYDLERNRSLRFYFRSPGYASALTAGAPTLELDDDQRRRLVRMTLPDHLRRLERGLDVGSGVEYWQTDDYLVDFVLGDADTPVPCISSFSDDPRQTPAAFDAFAAVDGVDDIHLEIEIADVDAAVEVVDDRRLRIPHWLLLPIC